MTLVATCLQCGSQFAAAPELAGTTVACPNCRAAIQVPLVPPSQRRKRKRERWALPVRPPPPPSGQPEYDEPLGDPAEPVAAPPIATPEDENPPPEHPLLLFPGSKHPEDLIDMTAMVDIVFFLLIFFLVTSMQSIQAVIEMPPPRAEKGVAGRNVAPVDYLNDPSYMVAVIDEDNNIWLDDEAVVGEKALRAMLRDSTGPDGQRKGLLIVGSAEATHGKLVMVLDAAADAGITDLLFSVTEDTNAL